MAFRQQSLEPAVQFVRDDRGGPEYRSDQSGNARVRRGASMEIASAPSDGTESTEFFSRRGFARRTSGDDVKTIQSGERRVSVCFLTLKTNVDESA
jgi:hypothetical protein